ncbi:MAG: hypothetical protein OEV74_08915 [Cyclobacteriaceae bacterium]|nr:hypothetical protein [Cyclobacteriaceae bacterium]MDH4296386.1 hypothetical protein [Cyclobacteriaceae bacterium]
MIKKRIIGLVIGFSVLTAVNSCVYHDYSEITTVGNTDQSLFAEVNEAGYVYYQNGDLLSPAGPSPHGSFKLRFNTIAQSSLDNTGELPANGAFAAGAVIVKEIYENNVLALYAVIKKSPGDASAADGHLWAEYALDGSTIVSITEKGTKCIDCHSGTPNRDLIRTFDLH